MAEMSNETAAAEAQPQAMPTSIDALRELNRLLESALRMGGDDGKSDASSTGVEGSGAEDGGGSGNAAAGDSWRLDTARRLGWVSFYHSSFVSSFWVSIVDV